MKVDKQLANFATFIVFMHNCYIFKVKTRNPYKIVPSVRPRQFQSFKKEQEASIIET